MKPKLLTGGAVVTSVTGGAYSSFASSVSSGVVTTALSVGSAVAAVG